MSIYSVWIPGEKGYKEHLDRMSVSYSNINAIKEQSDQFKNAIRENSSHISDQTRRIIASNEQIISAIDRGFNQIAEINEQGFSQVTSAIEDLHSDMNYFFGTVIQKLEYQNSILNGILNVLEAPFETQVKEFYRKGCLFVKQGFLEGAIDCFKESISLKMGEYFFPSYYQLGRIYLSGVEDDINVIDLKAATTYLSKAIEFGKRIAKTDPSFIPILADCNFFLSQSYYFQLTGKRNENERKLLSNAIKSCSDALLLNPNLSQGFYHFAKYISYDINVFEDSPNEGSYKLLWDSFSSAVRLDRNYLRSIIKNDPFYDGVFEPNMECLKELIQHLTKEKKMIAQSKLNENLNKVAKLNELNISQSKAFQHEFNKLKHIVDLASTNFNTGTYFGFDDCIIKLNSI